MDQRARFWRSARWRRKPGWSFPLLITGPEGLPAGTIAERLGVPPSSLSFHLEHCCTPFSDPAPRWPAADLCRRVRDDERAARLSHRKLLRGRADPASPLVLPPNCPRGGLLKAAMLSKEERYGTGRHKEMVRARYGSIAAAARGGGVLCTAAGRSACCGARRPRRRQRQEPPQKSHADGLFGRRARRGAGRRQSRPRLRQPAGDRRARSPARR